MNDGLEFSIATAENVGAYSVRPGPLDMGIARALQEMPVRTAAAVLSLALDRCERQTLWHYVCGQL